MPARAEDGYAWPLREPTADRPPPSCRMSEPCDLGHARPFTAVSGGRGVQNGHSPTAPDVLAWSMITRPLRHTARQLREASFRWIYPRAPRLHDLLFFRLRRLVASGLSLARSGRLASGKDLLFGTSPTDHTPLVSVIVPCYNHAPFLEARLLSISGQSYRHFEVILLDDASSDDSADLLKRFACQHPERTKIEINAHNSGSPFRQWQRGLELAEGELIWIAESDDFCDANFLASLVPCFRNRGVMLAFANTIFCDQSGERQVWSLQDYLPEWPPATWTQPFTQACQKLVERLWSRRNLIPNVSGCIFRAAERYPLFDDDAWSSMKACGDWIFYLQLARGGLISYSPEATNHYRQHTSNSSVNLQTEQRYLAEHISVAEWILSHYRLSTAACRSLQQELQLRWSERQTIPMPAPLQERIKALHPVRAGSRRQANLLLVTYSLVPGGGEVFPLRLANSLHAEGYGVTVLDCAQLPEEPGIARMLHPDVPLISLRSLEQLGLLINDLGIELAHSHHAWVDTLLGELLQPFPEVRHVITSHGMYDEMPESEWQRIGRILRPRVAGAAYVAEKNRAPLRAMGIEDERLVAIPNAAPDQPFRPIPRQQLGIADDAFVITLVSRAIPEKGWDVAIEAVQLARQRCGQDIQLLLVGEGPAAASLRQRHQQDSHVHFMGLQPDSRAFFAMADLGLLPTFFACESQPLTLIECLQAGRPYLASDIGEIKTMLSSPGGPAGMTIPLRDGKADPTAFAAAIMRCIHQPEQLASLRSCCAAAAAKFSWEGMVQAYIDLYERALHQPMH